MNICLTTIDWVAISAIATFAMALATFWSLRQNKSQLKELKRQWEELNTPRIALSLVKIDKYFCLRLKNHSSVLAHNIFININVESENNLTPQSKSSFIEFAEAINNMKDMTVEPNGTKELMLFLIDKNMFKPPYEGNIDVVIKYNDIEAYTKNVSLNLGELNIVPS